MDDYKHSILTSKRDLSKLPTKDILLLAKYLQIETQDINNLTWMIAIKLAMDSGIKSSMPGLEEEHKEFQRRLLILQPLPAAVGRLQGKVRRMESDIQRINNELERLQQSRPWYHKKGSKPFTDKDEKLRQTTLDKI